MILACQTQLKATSWWRLIWALAKTWRWGLSTINGQIAITRWLTHDIMAVTIKLDKPFPHVAEPDAQQHGYRAGQYADISFPSIEKPRSYSFAKAPENEGKNELTFFVRKVPNGELTTWLFAKDRVGSPVTVTGPFGSFWLREGEGPIICVAGGSGMSSIMALARARKQYRVQARRRIPVRCPHPEGLVLPGRDCRRRRSAWSGQWRQSAIPAGPSEEAGRQ